MSIVDINKMFPIPQYAYCNHLVKTENTDFNGDIILENAVFLDNRTIRELFLHDLDYFERNLDKNFVLCTNSNISLYREYIKRFDLNVNLFTSDDIREIKIKEGITEEKTLSQRWIMKHRSLITTPFSFNKVILYSSNGPTIHMMYQYENLAKWSSEGFIFLNTSTTPLDTIINIIAGAEIVVCASEFDYMYTIYGKEGSTLYFISSKEDEPEFCAEVNKTYKTGTPLYTIKVLPSIDTFAYYNQIKSLGA